MTPCLTCPTPTPFETLVALWIGDLPPAEAEALEAHLFSCDPCAEASDRLGKLVAGLRQAVPPVISHAQRDRLVAGGLRLHHTPVQSGIDAQARFTSEVDLLVHVLRGDLSGAEQVDVELLNPQGTAVVQLTHVPFDRQSGEILVACQRHYQNHPVPDPVFQVHAVAGGVRREVGRYFVRHTWG
jgi:hypothetical protein